MKGIRAALLIATVERYIALAVSFVTLATISQLLTPGEVGVSVLGTGVMLLSQSIREFSSGIYLIQRQQLKQDDVRSFVTLQMLATLVVFATITTSAPLIATMYDFPALAPYLRVVAFCLLFESVSVPIVALMRRDMAFAKLAAINTSGVLVFAGIAISLALSGFSFMSVAWAYFGSALTVATLAACSYRNLSIFRPRMQSWREIVVFGAYNGANIFLYRIYELVPQFALGRLVSLEAVALFNRSLAICQLPNKLILEGASTVMLPAFSAAVRSGADLRASYLRSLEYTAVLQWPAYLVLAVLAHPAVDIILGHQWIGIVPLVQIMAVASLFSFSAELNYPVLVAAGGMRYVFVRSLIVWPASTLMAFGAAYYGLHAAAAAWLVIIPFQAYVSIEFVRNYISFDWSAIAQAVKRSAIVSLCTVLGPLVIVISEGTLAISTLSTVAAGLLAAICWTAALRFVDHPLIGDARSVVAELSLLLRNGATVRYNASQILASIRTDQADAACEPSDPRRS